MVKSRGVHPTAGAITSMIRGRRRRDRPPISTAFVESAVNEIFS
jgi:hypothetical protein